MKFDILKRSDFDAGRVGKDAPQPLPGTVYNDDENRWELEVKSLEELVEVVRDYDGPVLLHAGCPNCQDLCIISLETPQSEEDAREERETSYGLS
jgi:hypothetical protein